MKTIKCIIIAMLAGLLAVLPGIQTAQAARTFNGTSDYIEAGSAVVTAEPLTMACWFKTTSAAGQVKMSIGTSGGTARWQMSGSVGGSGFCTSANAGGTTADASSGTIVSGQWHHIAGVFASSTSRTCYLDGAAGTTNATSITVSGVNRTIIGMRIASGAAGTFAVGDVAESAIWSVALSADEIASLAKGFSPRLIRPQSLVFYAPLVRSVTDIRGGVALTDTVPTTAASSHPPVRN